MDIMINIMKVAAIILVIIGAIYTFRVTQRSKETKDRPVNGAITKHPYVLNPIFIAYVVFAVIIIGVIAYYTVISN